METVYNKTTGLGGKVIDNFCDYYTVKWFDGTVSTVDVRELEWRAIKKAYYYLPNLQLRIKNWTIENRGEIIGAIVFLAITALFLFTFTKCVL